MRNRVITIVLIFLAAALAIHVLDRSTRDVRIDATAEDLYSLTPGTLQILDKMQEEGVRPVEITLYFSLTAGKTLPKFIKDFLSYEQYVRSLLKEYERAGRGKIQVAFVDPVPDSDEAQDALDLGLDGKPINQHGDLFFFGMVFQTQTGGKDTIEFLWPDRQETIEHQISKTLYSLLWPKGKRIGVLSSLEVLGAEDNPYLARMLEAQGKKPQEPWLVMRLLRELYQVEKIEPDTDRIPRDLYDLVVVIHPKDLPQQALFALDEWITGGGNAIVLLDPYCIQDEAPQDPQQPWAALQYQPASNLSGLMSAWGITREEDRFTADLKLALNRPTTPNGPAEPVVIDLALKDRHREETLNIQEPMMQGINDLRFFMAGALEVEERAGLTVVPLITSTSSGGTLTIRPGLGGEGLTFMDLGNAAKLRQKLTPGDRPVVLAAKISGLFPTAFPQGLAVPAAEGGEESLREPLPEQERKPATVIVIADVDFIADRVAFNRSMMGMMQTVNDNANLFMNAVDDLLGASELTNVRAKQGIRRPFTLFDEIEEKADEEYQDQERALRDDLTEFQEELQAKQRDMLQKNAALYQKRVQEEVDRLNAKIKEVNRSLFEVRKARRKALESEERKVRLAVMGWMPGLVLILGVGIYLRRRLRERGLRRS